MSYKVSYQETLFSSRGAGISYQQPVLDLGGSLSLPYTPLADSGLVTGLYWLGWEPCSALGAIKVNLGPWSLPRLIWDTECRRGLSPILMWFRDNGKTLEEYTVDSEKQTTSELMSNYCRLCWTSWTEYSMPVHMVNSTFKGSWQNPYWRKALEIGWQE